jgi:ubiquinone/menaquinone biosynthesis C-methylase UbiE
MANCKVIEEIEGAYLTNEMGSDKNPYLRLYHQERFRAIVGLMKQTKGNFLDVGCAEGYYVDLARELGYEECVRLDISRDLITRARQRNPTLNWVVGDAHRLPFKEVSFTTVLCSDVLDLQKVHPEVALQELTRVSSKYILLSISKHSPYFSLIRKFNLKVLNNLQQRDYESKYAALRPDKNKLESWLNPTWKVAHFMVMSKLCPPDLAKFLRLPSILVRVVKVIDLLLLNIPGFKHVGCIQILLIAKTE